MRNVKISPSILSADLGNLAGDLEKISWPLYSKSYLWTRGRTCCQARKQRAARRAHDGFESRRIH